MSSIARRSIRTTAAAAGIAALGLGLAGPALAAPSVSDLPAVPALDPTDAPAVDTAVPGLGAFTRAADTARSSTPALPDAFSFEAPKLDSGAVNPSYLSSFHPTAYTGSVDPRSLPTRINAATLPRTGELVSVDSTVNGHRIKNEEPALPSLDTANAFTGLASQSAVPGI
jgi:hypothetical protein